MLELHYRVPGARRWKTLRYATVGGLAMAEAYYARQGFECFRTTPPDACMDARLIPFGLTPEERE